VFPDNRTCAFLLYFFKESREALLNTKVPAAFVAVLGREKPDQAWLLTTSSSSFGFHYNDFNLASPNLFTFWATAVTRIRWHTQTLYLTVRNWRTTRRRANPRQARLAHSWLIWLQDSPTIIEHQISATLRGTQCCWLCLSLRFNDEVIEIPDTCKPALPSIWWKSGAFPPINVLTLFLIRAAWPNQVAKLNWR